MTKGSEGYRENVCMCVYVCEGERVRKRGCVKKRRKVKKGKRKAGNDLNLPFY